MNLNPGIMALLQAPPQGGGTPVLQMLLMWGGIIAIFYFIILRPQRKAARQHQEVLAALRRGDRVMTDGGILGEVVHLKEDQITIKSGESRFIVARAKIARVMNANTEEKAS